MSGVDISNSNFNRFDDFYSQCIYLQKDLGYYSSDSLFFPYNGYYGPWRTPAGRAHLNNHSIVITMPLGVLENIAGFEIENLN